MEVLVLAVALMVWTGFVSLRIPMRDWVKAKPVWIKFILVYGLFLCVLIFGVYGQGYDASQFIYNQF